MMREAEYQGCMIDKCETTMQNQYCDHHVLYRSFDAPGGLAWERFDRHAQGDDLALLYLTKSSGGPVDIGATWSTACSATLKSGMGPLNIASMRKQGFAIRVTVIGPSRSGQRYKLNIPCSQFRFWQILLTPRIDKGCLTRRECYDV